MRRADVPDIVLQGYRHFYDVPTIAWHDHHLRFGILSLNAADDGVFL